MTENPTPSTDRDVVVDRVVVDDRDDVEGHRRHFFGVDGRRDEADDDVEGHGRMSP